MSDTADVIVIGAGIIGASCAWRLAQAGLRVTVFDRSSPGAEASQAALGLLGFHGEPHKPAVFNELCVHSRSYFGAFVEEMHDATASRASYHAGGWLMVAFDELELAELEELYVLNSGLGVRMERPSVKECLQLSPALNQGICGALYFPDDAQVDNTALTMTVVKAAERAGATFERAAVTAVEHANGHMAGVRCAGQIRRADWVVLAAGCWSGAIDGVPSLPVVPVRGQALALAGQPLRQVVMSPRGYVVPKGKDQTLVGASIEEAGFKKANTLGGLAEITAAGVEISPALGHCEFIGAWSGLRPGTADELPIIGPFAELPNLIAATGHFRNGILLAPLTATMVRAMILNQKPPLDWQPFLPR